jgi:hypothetical protein
VDRRSILVSVDWHTDDTEFRDQGASMSMNPRGAGTRPAGDIDIDALFRNAPVLTTPHDFAAPDIFPDDAEFKEFLASVRADRAHDLA